MNNTNDGVRPRVFVATAIAVCLFGLVLRYLHQHSNRRPEAGSSVGQAAKDHPNRHSNIASGTTQNIGYAKAQLSQPPTNATPLDKFKSVQGEIEASVEAMNGPIAFCGRVVDQDDNPIPGAKVSLSYRTWKAAMLDVNAAQTKTELVTDESGGFEVTGVSGDRLTIENVSKPGYLPSPEAKRTLPFANSPQLFSANPHSPDIVRMWKKGDYEPTLSQEGFFGLQPDGRPYVIDLLTSKNVQSETVAGDLRVRITRPESVRPREKYPWTLEITRLSGGLMEARDDFLYRA